MIIEYSGQTSEQKIKTLRDSVQRALEEITESYSNDIVKESKETRTIIRVVQREQSSFSDDVEDRLAIVDASIEDLEAENVLVNGTLTAHTANIEALNANKASVTELTAATARVTALEASKADITDLTAATARIGTLETGKANVNLANVNNAWINNGTIIDGSIGSGKIASLSANKITSGTLDCGNLTVLNLNAGSISAGSLTVGGVTLNVTADTATIQGTAIANGTIPKSSLSGEVQSLLDGATETFTTDAVPTLANYPASSWATTSEKETHVGDICYVVNPSLQENGYSYRFSYLNNVFSWERISDSDVTRALNEIAAMQGDISGLQTWKTQTMSWMDDTDDGITAVQGRLTTAETTLGNKVDITTFNTLSNTVDGHTSSITTLTNAVSQKADGSTVSTLSTKVNTIEQNANGTSSTVSHLTTLLGTNADGTTKTGDIVQRMSSAETNITQNANQISLKANSSDVYNKSQVDGTFALYTKTADFSVSPSQIRSTIEASETAAKDYADGAVSDALTDYYTKSQIDQTASGIRTEVSQNYQTISGMSAYQTVSGMSDYQLVEDMDAYQLVSGMSDYQTVAGMSDYQTVAAMSSYYTKTQIDQTVSGINLAVEGKQSISGMSAYQKVEDMDDYQTVAAMASYYTKSQIDASLSAINLSVESKQSISGMSAYQLVEDMDAYQLVADMDDYQTVAGMSDYQTVSGMASYYTKAEIDITNTSITNRITAAETNISGEVTSRTTLIRSFNGGTLTAYQGEPYGVYTNASGSVDIVTLSWNGTTPTITGTVASYGSSISLLDGKGIITSEEDQYHNYPLRLYGEEGTILGSADPVAMQSVGVARSFIYMPKVEDESTTQMLLTTACDYNGSLMGGDINATIEMKANYTGQASSIWLTAGSIRAMGDFHIGTHNKVGGNDTASVNSYSLNSGTSYTGIGCYFDLTPGTYILSGSVSFDGNSTGRRAVQWERTTSGATQEYTHSRHVIAAGSATSPLRVNSVAIVSVPEDASTHRFSLRAWQNSGSRFTSVAASAKYVRIA